MARPGPPGAKKFKLILRVILGLIILRFSCIAYAQNPAPKVRHRSNAGQLDSTGWTDARSTEGKFSVRLPGLFDDFTVTNSDNSLEAGQFFVVETLTAEGVRLAVIRASYNNPNAADRYFKNWQTGSALRGKEENRRLTKYRGFDAVEIAVSDESGAAYARAIFLKQDLLLQIIESPLSQRTVAEKLKAAFFESLLVEP